MEGASNSVEQPAESTEVFEKVLQLLAQAKADHKVLEHPPCKTSEQSAKVRNTPLEWGAKTMIVCRPNGEQVMLIYPANRKLSWPKVKKVECVGKKFERAQQGIQQKLKVRPGGIPPFPSLFGMKGVIDQHLLANQTIAFNAGMTTRSVIMKASCLPLTDCTSADICDE